MPLPNITSVVSLRATLSFNTSDDTVSLPPGARSEHLATFEISGLPAVTIEDQGIIQHRRQQ